MRTDQGLTESARCAPHGMRSCLLNNREATILQPELAGRASSRCDRVSRFNGRVGMLSFVRTLLARSSHISEWLSLQLRHAEDAYVTCHTSVYLLLADVAQPALPHRSWLADAHTPCPASLAYVKFCKPLVSEMEKSNIL